MKRVLITGGLGYIGSHTAKAYAKNGYDVIVLDNLVYGHKDFAKWGTFIEGDIANEKLLDEIFSSEQVDAVSHFAAFAYVGESVKDPAKYYDNNVVKAHTLLKKACEHKVKVFQFSSTCATYGEPQKIPLTEDHPQNPINPYGMSKLFLEKIIQDFNKAYGINYSILRYFNASGASPNAEIGEDHNPETHLIPLVLDVAMGRREHISIFGDDYDTPDGTCIRDYIHVSDLADAHVLAVDKALKTNQNSIFNLGNGSGFSVKEVIEKAREVTGKTIEAKLAPRREGDPATLIGSSEKIKKELSWNPKYASLGKIIETAWKWHKKRFK